MGERFRNVATHTVIPSSEYSPIAVARHNRQRRDPRIRYPHANRLPAIGRYRAGMGQRANGHAWASLRLFIESPVTVEPRYQSPVERVAAVPTPPDIRTNRRRRVIRSSFASHATRSTARQAVRRSVALPSQPPADVRDREHHATVLIRRTEATDFVAGQLSFLLDSTEIFNARERR